MAGAWGRITLTATPRPAQQRLLELASIPEVAADQRLHLAAPPGSGKSLVGLELARQRGERTLVLVPNAHLVEQWKAEFLRHFQFPGSDANLGVYVSTDPTAPGVVTIATYQSLATPARDGGPLDALAHEAWSRDLARGGVPDPDTELAQLEASDPARYRRLLRDRVRVMRRTLTLDGQIEVTPLLHANARVALATILAEQVGTIILDECHHLLDHWAMVVTELVERLERRGQRITVIGLTATLPHPKGVKQQERYERILGDVDVEIPVPAVVVEGGLAPFRQLSVQVGLTGQERELLDDFGSAFRNSAIEVTATDAFRTWLVSQLVGVTLDGEDAYVRWLVDDAGFSRSVLRAHNNWSIALPGSLPVPPDAHEDLEDADLVRLLGRFHRERLHRAREPELVAVRDELVRVFSAFGLSLTVNGVRQGRSPLDQLLTRSDAKGEGAAVILAAEHAQRGDDLRALVALDFDLAPHPHALLRGALVDDAGSARRLHQRLATDPRTSHLDPVLVTGKTIRVGNVLADELADAVNLALAVQGSSTRCIAIPAAEGIQELMAEGSESGTRHLLPILTRLFGAGHFRCLVATRGLVGQGWDCPALNVLVDLTQTAGPVASPQLHGRTLRLDPARPDKVAHNYDVTAIADGMPGGDVDLDRWRRRQGHLWSLEVEDPIVLTRGRQANEFPLELELVSLVADQRDDVRAAWDRVTPPGFGEVRTEVVVGTANRGSTGVPLERLERPAGWMPPASAAAAGVGALAAVGALGALPLAAVAAGVAVAGGTWAGGTRLQRFTPRRLVAKLPTGRGRADGARSLSAVQLGRLSLVVAEGVRDGLVACGAVPERAATSAVRLEVRDGVFVVRWGDPVGGPPLSTATHVLLADGLTELLSAGQGLPAARYALLLDTGRSRRRALPCPSAAAGTSREATAFAAAFSLAMHTSVEAVYLRSPTGRQILLGALDEAPAPLGAASRHVWA